MAIRYHQTSHIKFFQIYMVNLLDVLLKCTKQYIDKTYNNRIDAPEIIGSLF